MCDYTVPQSQRRFCCRLKLKTTRLHAFAPPVQYMLACLPAGEGAKTRRVHSAPFFYSSFVYTMSLFPCCEYIVTDCSAIVKRIFCYRKVTRAHTVTAARRSAFTCVGHGVPSTSVFSIDPARGEGTPLRDSRKITRRVHKRRGSALGRYVILSKRAAR